ncbi:MAG: LytR/AlgR family response regulator transcription factor [Gemmatimonadota bacterium]
MNDGNRTFVIRSASCVRFVPESDVLWVESARQYVRLHLEEECTLYRHRMHDLEDELSGEFVRIHRSYLVRKDLVRELRRSHNGRYRIRLAGGEDLPVGSSYLRSTRRALGA